jgi:hypothetical protein
MAQVVWPVPFIFVLSLEADKLTGERVPLKLSSPVVRQCKSGRPQAVRLIVDWWYGSGSTNCLDGSETRPHTSTKDPVPHVQQEKVNQGLKPVPFWILSGTPEGVP